MATRVVTAEELLGVDRLEIELAGLINHVQQEKEIVSSNFLQLHSLLAVKELSLLNDLDEVVVRARHELAEKIRVLKELDTARESTERDLTENRVTDVREKNQLTIEDKIGEELSRDMSVVWVELDWNKEQLEQSMCDVCKIVNIRPFKSKDYSLKLHPTWYSGGKGQDVIKSPMQIAIDNKTQNIFVADVSGDIIHVFTKEGKHLYRISTIGSPIGIVLTDEYIFVTSSNKLSKIRKSNNELVMLVQTENRVWGIDIDEKTNIYACEKFNQSVIVFDKNLTSVNRINLQTSQIRSCTKVHSIKLYKVNMYIMFGDLPTFNLQIFSLEGELVRCLIPESEIKWSYFFSIDQLGNIIVADCGRDQIKVFSNEGEVLHTINSDMLPGDLEFICPTGIAIDRSNKIIIAHSNKANCLLAF